MGTSTTIADPARLAAPSKAGRIGQAFSRPEWWRLGGFYAFIAILHGVGWAAFAYYADRFPSLIGLGLAAYLFGLRHAFDADHIAAVDDTVRYLMQQGQRPLGIGFFFSLGHSTVVLVLSVVVAFAASWVRRELPEFQSVGAILGTAVSGAFLWLIGLLNVLVLLDILRLWGRSRGSSHAHDQIHVLLAKRGLLNRLFGGRLPGFITRTWQMYPLGLLFGLGFDTASEVALLAMTAGAAAGDLPIAAVVSLPILFGAGMCLVDTSDGVLMCKVYHWAFLDPMRKLVYNLTTTGLSIAVALGVGSIELVQVFARVYGLDSPAIRALAGLELNRLGFWIVAGFLVAWLVSYSTWKLCSAGKASRTTSIGAKGNEAMDRSPLAGVSPERQDS